jgi:hypothetical protein
MYFSEICEKESFVEFLAYENFPLYSKCHAVTHAVRIKTICYLAQAIYDKIVLFSQF